MTIRAGELARRIAAKKAPMSGYPGGSQNPCSLISVARTVLPKARKQVSPDRQASLERSRRLAAAGGLPPMLAQKLHPEGASGCPRHHQRGEASRDLQPVRGHDRGLVRLEPEHGAAGIAQGQGSRLATCARAAARRAEIPEQPGLGYLPHATRVVEIEGQRLDRKTPAFYLAENWYSWRFKTETQLPRRGELRALGSTGDT